MPRTDPIPKDTNPTMFPRTMTSALERMSTIEEIPMNRPERARNIGPIPRLYLKTKMPMMHNRMAKESKAPDSRSPGKSLISATERVSLYIRIFLTYQYLFISHLSFRTDPIRILRGSGADPIVFYPIEYQESQSYDEDHCKDDECPK